MARLQDFSDVTPSSSSDKLLIVQSAGQGLATLDTAGQQIANNTSVSQLHTTSKTLVGAVNELNKPTALTLSNVPTGVTSNSKAYKLSGGLILIMVEVTFSSASSSWQNAFDIAWSGTAITNSFGVVTNDQNDNTYAQAYWNTDKITVRVSSPKATLYRGQIIVPAV